MDVDWLYLISQPDLYNLEGTRLATTLKKSLKYQHTLVEFLYFQIEIEIGKKGLCT